MALNINCYFNWKDHCIQNLVSACMTLLNIFESKTSVYHIYRHLFNSTIKYPNVAALFVLSLFRHMPPLFASIMTPVQSLTVGRCVDVRRDAVSHSGSEFGVYTPFCYTVTTIVAEAKCKLDIKQFGVYWNKSWRKETNQFLGWCQLEKPCYWERKRRLIGSCTLLSLDQMRTYTAEWSVRMNLKASSLRAWNCCIHTDRY